MERRNASDFHPNVLELFDKYVHGGITRREFLDRAASYAVGGLTAAALLESLAPNYALAQQVPPDDARLQTAWVDYPSAEGHGAIRAYYVKPGAVSGKRPGVVVVHENRGLNPYIQDVARRVGVAGFLALAPDGLTPAGGYPGDDDKGREMQSKLDPAKLMADFVAATRHLQAHADCTGKVGIVGFCYGGLVANTVAVRVPTLAAAVPFYGRQPAAADVPAIKAPLLIHYAGNDAGVNGGWAGYEAALKAAGVTYTMHMYDGANHGFHNDTTPRFDKAAADLAWRRTLDFFNDTLR